MLGLKITENELVYDILECGIGFQAHFLVSLNSYTLLVLIYVHSGLISIKGSTFEDRKRFEKYNTANQV